MARPAVFINCKLCGKTFKRKGVRSKFCSKKCVYIGRPRGKRRGINKVETVCGFCSNIIYKWPCHIRKSINKIYYCGFSCKNQAMKHGKTSFGFKESTRSPLNPYKRCMREGKFVYEHRWLMEQKLGRKFTKDEHVHHKNGNQKDNRLENLEVLSRSEHAKTHFN